MSYLTFCHCHRPRRNGPKYIRWMTHDFHHLVLISKLWYDFINYAHVLHFKPGWQRNNGDEVQIDAFRRTARISKLDRKANEYIREKMNAQDTVLDDITRKQLIWCGHVERMKSTRLPKIMINWKPEGRKRQGRPRRTWKEMGYIQLWMKEISG